MVHTHSQSTEIRAQPCQSIPRSFATCKGGYTTRCRTLDAAESIGQAVPALSISVIWYWSPELQRQDDQGQASTKLGRKPTTRGTCLRSLSARPCAVAVATCSARVNSKALVVLPSAASQNTLTHCIALPYVGTGRSSDHAGWRSLPGLKKNQHTGLSTPAFQDATFHVCGRISELWS